MNDREKEEALMRNVLLSLVATCALTIVGCANPSTPDAHPAPGTLFSDTSATDVPRTIAYVKDNRTGLCFAYIWGGGAYGGPALATVPCGDIPPHLLNMPRAE